MRLHLFSLWPFEIEFTIGRHTIKVGRNKPLEGGVQWFQYRHFINKRYFFRQISVTTLHQTKEERRAEDVAIQQWLEDCGK